MLGLRVIQVLASTYASLARRSKKVGSTIQVFVASIVDIKKALYLKPKLSLAKIVERLLEHYRKFTSIFDLQKAAKLLLYRPSINYKIPLEKDKQGKDREVPQSSLYSISRDKLLVLQKELVSLLNKDFIQESKLLAVVLVLFVRKLGSGLRFYIDYYSLNAIIRKD